MRDASAILVAVLAALATVTPVAAQVELPEPVYQVRMSAS